MKYLGIATMQHLNLEDESPRLLILREMAPNYLMPFDPINSKLWVGFSRTSKGKGIRQNFKGMRKGNNPRQQST